MDAINTDRSESILRVELNRPTKKNAMTYVTLADNEEFSIQVRSKGVTNVFAAFWEQRQLRFGAVKSSAAA